MGGVNLLVGCQDGLKFLDRSGQGEVYTLIKDRPFKQIDVLQQLNIAITVSGKKDKLRVYYLDHLQTKIYTNSSSSSSSSTDEFMSIDDIENVTEYKYVHYESGRFLCSREKHDRSVRVGTEAL